MLFNSIAFLVFFPLVTILYYLLPHAFRWMLLLAASCVFYMYFIPVYILILFITILIDYTAAIYIEKHKGRARHNLLIISIISTCLVLFVLKYFNFFLDNASFVGGLFKAGYAIPHASIILPIGLSFHTFQSLSYVIEVYRGHQKAERHFGIYSLYVMFYPQLVAGPIERPQNLLVQFREKHKAEYENLVNGLRLILFGLFIKMVIADNLAPLVDQIYKNPAAYSSASIISGLFLYSFQIYSDFYGYSTIACGCALAMGFRLMDNFQTPYLSRNIGEFWRRWHISLSTWFRDYIFLPLAYAISGKLKKDKYAGMKTDRLIFFLAMTITFFLSGLWHGANWTFVCWGLLLASFFLAETWFNRTFKVKQHKKNFGFLHILLSLKTFVLITIAWVFFRSPGFATVQEIFRSIFRNFSTHDDFHLSTKVLVVLAIFLLSDFLLFNGRFDTWCARQKSLIRWSIYTFMIFSILVLAGVEMYPFIYFQF